MTLRLTIETLRHAYDYLCSTDPFCRWNLPDADDVTFVVAKGPTVHGWCDVRRGRKPVLAISNATVGHTSTLMETLAHEMIHLHEELSGTGRGKGEHSAAFQKWALQVCRVHGFDPRAF